MNVNFPFLSPDVGNGQMTEYRCNECNFPFLPPDVGTDRGQRTVVSKIISLSFLLMLKMAR